MPWPAYGSMCCSVPNGGETKVKPLSPNPPVTGCLIPVTNSSIHSLPDDFVVQVLHYYEINVNIFHHGQLVDQMRLWKGHWLEEKADETIAQYAVTQYLKEKQTETLINEIDC